MAGPWGGGAGRGPVDGRAGGGAPDRSASAGARGRASRTSAWRVPRRSPEARLRREDQPGDGSRLLPTPVPAAVRRAARVRLAEVGAVGRGVRVPGPRGRAVQAGAVAVRVGAGA